MLKPSIFLIIFAFLVGPGCSSAKVRVIRGDDEENHRVVAFNPEREAAYAAALEAAEEFCAKRSLDAVVWETNKMRSVLTPDLPAGDTPTPEGAERPLESAPEIELSFKCE